MQISPLENHPQIQHNKVLADTHAKFAKLLRELERRTLPEDVINSINQDIEQANAFKGTDNELASQLKKCQASVLKLIEKKLNLVSKKALSKTLVCCRDGHIRNPSWFRLWFSFAQYGLLRNGISCWNVYWSCCRCQHGQKGKSPRQPTGLRKLDPNCLQETF